MKATKSGNGLVVIETHPVQYHAPVYRMLQQCFGIPVTAIYSSDFSLAGYHDKEFRSTFAWDTDLLSGYTSLFLSRTSSNGSRSMKKISTGGIEKAIEKVQPKTVLLVGYAVPFYQKAFHYAWRKKYPILFRAETTDHALKRNWFKRWSRDKVLQWLYRRCHRLLYIGRHSYAHFKRLGCPEEKLVFSPYCVDTAPFQCEEKDRIRLRTTVRQNLGIEDDEIAFLFSGKQSFRKGPDLLLNATKRLPEEIRRKIAVLYMGDGELRGNLEICARQSPFIKARFLGFQNQSQLSGYYHAADLLVVPSRHSEVWGLVVNEGLHHGLPCIASDAVGCALDLIDVGITGEIFETESVEGLKAALLRAFSLINQAEIRSKCRDKVRGYTVEKAAEGIANAYRTVTNE